MRHRLVRGGTIGAHLIRGGIEMRRRITATCASVFLLVALASGVGAQSAPPRIVQASDGTLYLLEDGARFTLVGDTIGDDELAQYSDGGPAGSAVLLGMLAPAANGTTPGATGGQDLPNISGPIAPQFVSVQGNSPGRSASVTVQTDPGATCTLAYTTPSGTRSNAAGLGQQMAGASGVVTWSFLIGGATRRGVGMLSVSCPGGSLSSPITIG